MRRNGFLRRIGLVALSMTLAGISPVGLSQDVSSFEVPQSDAPLTQADLATLVGPIALYADDLVGIVLPASTYPLQIVQASRFLDRFENDASLQPDPAWDDSVVALLNYPEVLRMLDTNIEWTWALGEAVLDQEGAVLDAIQGFRRQAMQAGNLASDSQQTVTQDGELIEIAPADPEVIYIPYYEPARVVVTQPSPVIYYYSDPYPLYYYPYPLGYTFSTGFFWGVTTAFHIGWFTHDLHVYHYRNRLHPYYGRTYYSPYYARRGVNININLNRVNNVWRPNPRRAARPVRAANRTRVTVNTQTGNRAAPRTRTATPSAAPRQNLNRSRVNTQQSTRAQQHINRSTALTQGHDRVAAQPQRSIPQRVDSHRRTTGADNNAAAAPTRTTPTFANPRSRLSKPARVEAAQARRPAASASTSSSQQSPSFSNTRTQRAAPARASAAPARSGSRASRAPARSSSRGSGQHGRTRR